MKEGIFTNGNSGRGDTRDIMIIIEDEFISFYFHEQYLRQKAWINEEIERREEVNEEPLNQDELANHEFYWIPKEDWIRDKTQRLDRGDNWANHMSHKNWFTKEMKKFIDDNT